MIQLPFANRAEAGRLLAVELASLKLPANVIVLALPRGGLPVGLEVAKKLRAPLDVVIVRKLGVPWRRNWRWARLRAVHFRRLTKN
jgi:putative phosphoribosyl transferase